MILDKYETAAGELFQTVFNECEEYELTFKVIINNNNNNNNNNILTGKPLGRHRRRWEDNIRMDLDEIGINAGKWVDSAQDRNY